MKPIENQLAGVGIDPKPMKKTRKRSETDADMAAKYEVSIRTIERWRSKGAPFDDKRAMDSWLAAKRTQTVGGGPSSKAIARDLAQKRVEYLVETIRSRKIENDVCEGKLVPRAWVIQLIQLMAGEVNSIRSRSESEHPLRFAEADGDAEQCRVVISGIWDEIAAALQALGRRMKDTAPAASH